LFLIGLHFNDVLLGLDRDEVGRLLSSVFLLVVWAGQDGPIYDAITGQFADLGDVSHCVVEPGTSSRHRGVPSISSVVLK
jgi:hypothetical protein